MTATQIANLINEALKEFGRYSYFDKGPEEVMNIPAIVNALNAQSAEECKTTLLELLTSEPKRGNRAGAHELLVSTVLVSMQEVDDARWTVLMSDPRLRAAL